VDRLKAVRELRTSAFSVSTYSGYYNSKLRPNLLHSKYFVAVHGLKLEIGKNSTKA